MTGLSGYGGRARDADFDAQALPALAGGGAATLTAIAWVVTGAGSFVLLAPLSIAFLLPLVVKLIVARPRPTIEHLSHLSSLSFPSEHTTQAAAIYLTIAIMLSKGLMRGSREAAIVLGVVIALAVAR